MKKTAVMIDRDGTMGGDTSGGNFRTPADYRPFPGTREAFSLLRAHGIAAIIVTNQSCIARGLDGGYDFAAEFRDIGAADWFICPHDKQDGCTCRKPATGLIEQARDKYGLDLSRCYMVGDRWSDMAAGGRMGMRLLPVRTGFGKETLGRDRALWAAYQPAYIAEDLLDAVKWIIRREETSENQAMR